MHYVLDGDVEKAHSIARAHIGIKQIEVPLCPADFSIVVVCVGCRFAVHILRTGKKRELQRECAAIGPRKGVCR